jgi:hypothetical protein
MVASALAPGVGVAATRVPKPSVFWATALAGRRPLAKTHSLERSQHVDATAPWDRMEDHQ